MGDERNFYNWEQSVAVDSHQTVVGPIGACSSEIRPIIASVVVLRLARGSANDRGENLPTRAGLKIARGLAVGQQGDPELAIFFSERHPHHDDEDETGDAPCYQGECRLHRKAEDAACNAENGSGNERKHS